MRDLTGALLVATPALRDPQFTRTVVLIVQHDGDGCLGVVLNRPGTELVGELAAPLAAGAALPARVFTGGPVGPELLLCLTAPSAPALAAWTVVDPSCPPALTGPLRLFRGYAGWGAAQLEAEIAEGSWWVLATRPSDVFCARPEELYREVLRRAPVPLRWAATLPADPTWN